MTAKRTSRLHLRLAEGERVAIRRRAASAGLTVSAYLRSRALKDDGRPVIRTDAEQLKRLYADLRRAGGNLNQCARELNARHCPDRIGHKLEAALDAVARASEDVSAFIADTRTSA